MKKILFLLLCTVSIYGQTSTGQEQSFPYGIVNESLQTITTPPYLTTTGMDGTQGKIPSAYIAKTADVADSLATKENIANKSDSYTASSSTTYASTKALVDGLATKQNTLTNPITGTGTTNYIPKFTASGTVGNSLIFDNGTRVGISTANPNAGLDINGGGAFISGWTMPTMGVGKPSGFWLGSGYSGINTTSTIWSYNLATNTANSLDIKGRKTTFFNDASYGVTERMSINTNGNVLINTTTDNGVDKLQINGSTKTTALTLATAPTTSAGTYDILTRNTSTGVVEKKLNADFIHTSGNETITGTKLFQDTVYMDALEISSIGIDISSGAYFTNLGVTTATAPRSILLPDASGTIALVETVKPYKVYTALLSQSGTSAPTATVLENTLGGTVVWTRISTGQYVGTLTGAFTDQKTIIFVNRSNPAATAFDTNMAANVININTVGYTTFSNSAYVDGQTNSASIEIRVYL